jgi:membrane protein DedA with SNARE-associated domain
MEHYLLDLMLRNGPWMLFVAQTLGIFGLPVPDELLLTLAGGLVRRGDLRGWATVAAAISGSMTGITLSYMLGRLGAQVLPHLPASSTELIQRGQSWFTRFGKWLLVFGCFVPGVRHVTAIAAGTARLEFRTFCAYAYPGVALWSTTFVAIGYYASAGERWEDAAILLHKHLVALAILLAALVVGYAFARERTPSSL